MVQEEPLPYATILFGMLPEAPTSDCEAQPPVAVLKPQCGSRPCEDRPGVGPGSSEDEPRSGTPGLGYSIMLPSGLARAYSGVGNSYRTFISTRLLSR